MDAWYRAGGYLQVSTAPAHDGSWQAVADACAELGVPDACRPLSEAEVRARCDSPDLPRRGLLSRGRHRPAGDAWRSGFAPRLLQRGVTIFEGSRVAAPAGRRARASRRAPIAAACARAPPCSPPARRSPATGRCAGGSPSTSSHMVITEPVPDVVAELGWTGGECITDSRAMIHYFRTTPDGRIAFGWGGGRIAPGARLDGRVELDRSVVAEVERHLVRFFPGLAGRRIEHAWGGPIDVSPTHLPVVAASTVAASTTRSATPATGSGPRSSPGAPSPRWRWTAATRPPRLPIVEPPRVRVPPEPLRYAGGTIVRAALLRRERLEEEGRRPGPLTRAISGLPERIGIHIGR